MPNHAYSASLWFLSQGTITRATVVSMFNMTTEDEVQLDEMADYYAGLSTSNKRSYHSDVEAAGILAESGYLTQAQYKTLLGLT